MKDFFSLKILDLFSPVFKSLGVEYDKIINNEIRGGKRAVISTPASKVLVAVIPTDEEVIIARDCYDLLKDHCNE